MTIKQQGGIFGRNPSFNDLEAEQATVNGKVNIQTNRPQIFLYEQDRTDNNARIECSFDNLSISQVDDSNGSPVARLTVEMDTGDVYVNDGNLVIGTSGKGIDFSATSGTGTSELFDDYEEGTWAPNLTPGTSGTITLNTTNDIGTYTKVGRLVHAQGGVSVDSVSTPSGYVDVELPFALGSYAGRAARFSASIVVSDSVAANVSDFVAFGVTGFAFRIYLGDSTSFTNDAAQEFQAGTELYFSVTYQTDS